ncbi:hypothetical protein MPH_04004 [Macrophomina phaseolina MS6]|uniref:Uncharacterized protein n=1 Tax=Macrophomina phaseolina (strain MS6) TaxID=1126212 RepID=K2RVE8_MACPH|nr:hypothetical protein MPH_04004 [Macrophomina phaseolina MS6]
MPTASKPSSSSSNIISFRTPSSSTAPVLSSTLVTSFAPRLCALFESYFKLSFSNPLYSNVAKHPSSTFYTNLFKLSCYLLNTNLAQPFDNILAADSNQQLPSDAKLPTRRHFNAFYRLSTLICGSNYISEPNEPGASNNENIKAIATTRDNCFFRFSIIFLVHNSELCKSFRHCPYDNCIVPSLRRIYELPTAEFQPNNPYLHTSAENKHEHSYDGPTELTSDHTTPIYTNHDRYIGLPLDLLHPRDMQAQSQEPRIFFVDNSCVWLNIQQHSRRPDIVRLCRPPSSVKRPTLTNPHSTSPSIYLTLDGLSAERACGASTTPVAAPTHVLASFDPSEISTITWDSTVINNTATLPGGTIVGSWTVTWWTTTRPLDWRAYSSQCAHASPGATPTFFPVDANVSTVIPADGSAALAATPFRVDPCRPFVAIPARVTRLDPAWASCFPDAEGGAFDPPWTITPVSGAKNVPGAPTSAPVEAPSAVDTTRPPTTTMTTAGRRSSIAPDLGTILSILVSSLSAAEASKQSASAASASADSVTTKAVESGRPSSATESARSSSGGSSRRTRSSSSTAGTDAATSSSSSSSSSSSATPSSAADASAPTFGMGAALIGLGLMAVLFL